MLKPMEINDRAKRQAAAKLTVISNLLAELVRAEENDDKVRREETIAAIDDFPLAAQVRADWHSPGEGPGELKEYEILLCTGGPAVKISGDLDAAIPSTVALKYQDWFTPWIDYPLSPEEQAILLEYADWFDFSGG